jgi:hypothetical protein
MTMGDSETKHYIEAVSLICGHSCSQMNYSPIKYICVADSYECRRFIPIYRLCDLLFPKYVLY